MVNQNSSPQKTVQEDLPLLISAYEAAKRLGISPRSLWTHTHVGTIAHVKLGRRVMYSPRSLQDWVLKNTFVGGDKNGKSLQG